MIKILKKAGFEVVEQTGSHVKLKLPGSGNYVTVPMHKGDIPIGTFKSIQKQVQQVLDDVAKQGGRLS